MSDRTAGVLVILGVALLFGGCAATHNREYSTGFRDGTIQKLSEKGFLWKTLEGELAMDGVKVRGSGGDVRGGSVMEFSLVDRELFRRLEALPSGTRVRLHYRKVMWCGPWVAGTTYHVQSFEEVK